MVDLIAKRQDFMNKILQKGVNDGVFPGATACISLRAEGSVLTFEAAAGVLGSSLGEVKVNSIYDLASITKPFVAMAALALIRDGVLEFDTKVGDVLEIAKNSQINDVTLEQLFRHSGGLSSWGSLYLEIPFSVDKEKAKQIVLREAIKKIDYEAGAKVVYSDIGYIIAGAMIESALDKRLDEVVNRYVIRPLLLSDQIFYAASLSDPLRAFMLQDCAATEQCQWRKRYVHGDVHDENAYMMGGVAGHAGLFGSAKGVAAFGRAVLDSWFGHGDFLPQKLLYKALEPTMGTTQRFGWDGKSEKNSSAGTLMSIKSIGHLGFTGTSIWCDPVHDFVVVLLTNRVFPTRENEKIKQFRPFFHDAMMQEFF